MLGWNYRVVGVVIGRVEGRWRFGDRVGKGKVILYEGYRLVGVYLDF